MSKWLYVLTIMIIHQGGFSLASPPFIPQEYASKEQFLRKKPFLQKIYNKKQEQYQIIKRVLEKYQRPFTVLDLSETDSYFTLRILQDFPESVSIFVERAISPLNKTAHPMTEHLKKFPFQFKNCIIAQKNITFSDIERLAKSDHFDVVLAMRYPKRLFFTEKKEAEHIIQTFSHMANDVFFEISEDQTLLQDSLEEHTSTESKESWDEMSLYHVYQDNPAHLRKHYFRNSGIDCICHSSREENLIEKLGLSTTYTYNKPIGISLVTFKALHGTHPSLLFLEQELAKLEKDNKNLLFPHQVYVQGRKVTYLHNPYVPFYNYTEDLSLQMFAKQTCAADIHTFLKAIYAISEE